MNNINYKEKIDEYVEKLKISSTKQTFYQDYLKHIIKDNSNESIILEKGCKHFIKDFSIQCEHNKRQIEKWTKLLNNE